MVKPWMHKLEYELIVESLDKTKQMLEWGSGTSTAYFSQYVQHIDSIEHDLEWINTTKKYLRDNNVVNATLHEVPWDSPRPARSLTEYYMFDSYINYVDKLNKKYDVVLIDGRARFWCAEKILPYLADHAVVFIHDYWAYRDHMMHPSEIEKYKQIFNWYTELASVKHTEQTIIKLKKK